LTHDSVPGIDCLGLPPHHVIGHGAFFSGSARHAPELSAKWSAYSAFTLLWPADGSGTVSHLRTPADHDGERAHAEARFYYFSLEAPEHHLLGLIDQHMSVRQQLKDSRSDRSASIDLIAVAHSLLIRYLYGTTSERIWWKNCACIQRGAWFTALGFDQKIPHHSTLSKNRHRRFQKSKLFEAVV